ncbi:MAG: LptF/LptG family permease [Candidatus Omnitrophota bacterium]|nr:MAG: LptF/LptG family permease [Candidatus Omnitrophota bacterium]
MRILDKYILKNTISGYLFILLVFVGLYFIIDLFSSLSDILKAKAPVYIILKYYAFMIPLIFLRVSSLALLISMLYTFGEMNRTNEIVSMRASGVSIFRIAFPVMFIALFISFFSLFVQEEVLVKSQQKVEDIKMTYIKKKTSRGSEKRNFAFPSQDMIFFVRKFSPKDATLYDVSIFQEDQEGNILKKIVCSKISYQEEKWLGKDMIEYTLNERGNIIGKPLHWPEKEINLDRSPKDLATKHSIFSEYSSLKTLKWERERLKKVRAKNILSNLTIDFHQKIADPLTHFFLIVGVLPLCLAIKKRKVALSALGVGFIFGFIYYCLFSFGIALGKAGILLPALSVWVTPVFFVTVGISGIALLR